MNATEPDASEPKKKKNKKEKKSGGFSARLKKIFRFGIGTKLSAFIGVLIILSISIISAINLWQQSTILSASYAREATSSRRYISSFVLELDNIAQNLIRIEEFRDRVKKQQRALKKYQTRKQVIYQKKISLFGIRTDLFGTVGKGRVFLKRDTYYSEYLSDEDIKNLETRTRALLQAPGEPPISDRNFAVLTILARNFVARNSVVENINRSLLENTDKSKEEKLSKALLNATKLARYRRFLLDQAIVSILSKAQKRKINELGLDTNRIRIQIYPEGSIIPGVTSSPTLDTKIFDPASPLNSEVKDETMQSGLEHAYLDFTATAEIEDYFGREIVEYVQDSARALIYYLVPGYVAESDRVKLNNMELQVLYSPHYRNPSSSIRVNELLKVRETKRAKELQEYLAEDARISQEIATTAKEIEHRLDLLKERKPPLPPYRDADFKKLYQQYEGLVKERSTAYEKFFENKSELYSDALIDAVGYLREATLQDQILIYFHNSPSYYDEYMSSEKTRKARRQRWEYMRKWIYAGKIETPSGWLKSKFPEGMVGYSRTEAEAIMWKIDSVPLLSLSEKDVIDLAKEENFAGVVRTIVDHSAGLEAMHKNTQQVVITATAITLLSIILAIYLARVVTRKIKKIIKSAEDVGGGNLNVEFEQAGNDEFGNLTLALNHMVTGLRDREKIKGILGSMVDPVVVNEAMKDLQALKNGTEKKITSFFSDVAGFSSISESLTSVQLAELLNEYLSAMTIILKEHNGVLDKYIGDAIVGIFNAPVDVENYTLKAVHASFRMVEKIHDLRQKWKHENKYNAEAREMQFRIGLNTGLAKVGFMGTDALASYTMMGDSVNLAARLEAAAKDYGVIILASQNVYEEVKDAVVARKLDFIRVKGKNEPVTIYELITDNDRRIVTRGVKDSTILYEQALEFYLKRDWGKAIKIFQESEKIRGREDKAVQMLIKRIEHYRKSPPPDDWDGAFTRDHK